MYLKIDGVEIFIHDSIFIAKWDEICDWCGKTINEGQEMRAGDGSTNCCSLACAKEAAKAYNGIG